MARVLLPYDLPLLYSSAFHNRVSPFELVLSEPPQGFISRREISPEKSLSVQHYRQQFRNAIKNLVSMGAQNFSKAQGRYKRNLNKRIRPLKPVKEGNWVYITREQPIKDSSEVARRHKLQSKGEGPFLVLKNADRTATIIRNDGTTVIISRDSISIAPELAEIVPQTSHPDYSGSKESRCGQADVDAKRKGGKGPIQILQRPAAQIEEQHHLEGNSSERDVDVTGREYLVDRVLKYRPADDHFLTCWYSYSASEDTWEPSHNLPWNMMVVYFRRKQQLVPESLLNFRH